MNKYKLLTFTVALLLCSVYSCKKIKNALQVDIGFTTKMIEFTIPAVPLGGSATVDMPIEINLDSVLSANGFSLDKVRKVRLDNIELIQENGSSTNNLEVISHVRIAMASDTKPEFVEVAKLDDNTLPMADPMKLTLPGNPDLDLKDYFQTHQFTYRITAGLREPTLEEKECVVRTRYVVSVGG